MSLDTVKRYSDFQWVSFEAPNRLFMAYSIHEAQKTVTAEQETVVRVRAGIRGKVVSVEPENTRFSVLSDENGWLKVLSENGAEGYVKTNTLSEIRETIPENPSYVKPVFERMEFVGNISLGFDYVDSQKYGIIHLNEHVEAGEKVNVISPTWYVLQGDDGSFLSRADSEYIRIAHENNMEVWPLVENFTGQNDVLRTLRSFTARQKMIATLIGEMEAYGFDGLNLDFEGLSAETAVHYIQFIRELRLALNGRGKYLSVDTYIPYSWNAKYRIGELGELADYVVVMCYDEAWEKAGPNASLDFVSGGIEKSLNAVSKDRLLIGIPFYTYGWYEADGVLKKSEISMKKCAEILNEI